jgi:hypothetical protein
MSFTDQQLRKLRAPVPSKFVKERTLNGKTLSYVEGWHIIAEANRIFGHEGWDRETVSVECVWNKPVGDQFGAAYMTRVRITVRAGRERIVRDGYGSGEALAATPGQAHERAIKAAETDATKRAFCTFGNPFGLSLYNGGRVDRGMAPKPVAAKRALSLPPALPEVRSLRAQTPIDKSLLTFSEPKRKRDPDHLKFVAKQACLVCGRTPSQAHHLKIAQPKALGRKVSDEFTVPLCSIHHSQLHADGVEARWWNAVGIDPMPIAEQLWRETTEPSSRGSEMDREDQAAGPRASST